MLLCNPNHPNHYGRDGNWRRNGFGGCVGDMSAERGCQWFSGTIHSTLFTHKSGYTRCRIVHELNGKWTTLFEDLAVCCRVHCEQAITIKMALIANKQGIPQVHPFPVLRERKNKNRFDSYARAFILACKVGLRNKS